MEPEGVHARRTSEREVVDRAVAEGVPLVAAAIAAVYLAVTVAHLLLLPSAILGPMVLLSSATAASGLAVFLAVRRRPPAPAWGAPWVAFFGLAVLVNTTVHAWLEPRSSFGVHYAVAAMGLGLLLLDRRWLATMLLTTAGAFAATAVSHGSDDPFWRDASAGVAFAIVIAWLARDVRVRNLMRLAGALDTEEALEEALRRREAWLRLQAERLQRLVTSPALLAGDWLTLVREAVDVGAATFRADRASVWLYSPDGSVCRLADRYTAATGEHDSGLEVPVARYPAYHAALQRERVLDVNDARTDERVAELREDYVEPLGIGSMLDAPIRSGGRLVGVLGCARHGAPRPWTVDEVNFAASVAEVIGIAIQSAERERGEEERRDLEARMQEAIRLESLGVLAGGVAHDFNNVLTTILGNAELLLEELPEGDARRSALEIERAGRRGADFAQKMLAYAGRAPFAVEPVDLAEVAAEMVRVGLPPGTPGVEVVIERPELPAPTRGDAVQIQQVVLNLVTNAVDAVRERGGRVVVRSGTCEMDAAALEASVLRGDARPGRFSYVEVQDDGPGMSAEVAARIFDPFFTTKFRGRGLGLAAVHGIVRAHAGTLRIETAPGRGTTMRLLLPWSELRVPGPEARAEPSPRRGRGVVLVVDDEAAVRSVARRMLERGGFEVLEAEGVGEAQEVFRRAHGLRAAVLDVTMPDGDGVELARWLRAEAPGLPIVLITGYDESAATGRLGAGPHTGYVHKPFRAATLLEALQGVLGEVAGPAAEKDQGSA